MSEKKSENSKNGTKAGEEAMDSKKLIKISWVILAVLLASGVIILKFGNKTCGNLIPCDLPGKSMCVPVAGDKPAPVVSAKTVVKEEKTKIVVTELTVGNLIAKHKQQQWTLVADNPKTIAKQMQSLLAEFKAMDVSKEETVNEGTKLTTYKFAVRFWQLSPLTDDLSALGMLEKNTPFPVIRSEAYINSRGGVNPLVLEEKIFLELTLNQ